MHVVLKPQVENQRKPLKATHKCGENAAQFVAAERVEFPFLFLSKPLGLAWPDLVYIH